MSGKFNLSKNLATKFFAEQVQMLADEVAHPQPWPLPGMTDRRKVIVIPP